MTAQERYDRDPIFRMLVTSFYNMYQQAGDAITPSEIREAAGLAWQIYRERHASPPMVAPPGWDGQDIRK